MTDIAIRAEGLGKSYRISHQGARYRTLRESLVDSIRRPLRREGRTAPETIWALKGVDFEVKQGEALGIIGRNGAGKSTLLKILSRITSPTTGRADVYGTLGSLLEIGTGFHPELTGRENVFLNGAILGMRRREIERRFDEIVAFAEVERFLDTPVKHYSTGMYMRLAFAVAAHLRTDILVVDEVLAVGDAAFQEKCLGKMGDATGEGRTVLFVSHNMAAISQLCSSAVLLDHGMVTSKSGADEVIAKYMGEARSTARVDFGERSAPNGTGGAVYEWAEVRSADDAARSEFSIGDTVRVTFRLRIGPTRPRTRMVVSLRTADGLPVARACDADSRFALPEDHGRFVVNVDFEDVRLYPATYHVSLWVTDPASVEEYDRVDDCLVFRIVDGGRLTTRWLPRFSGLIFLTPRWESVAEPEGRPSPP
jgi:lipopolysaccharide transport system ATP-binding protein